MPAECVYTKNMASNWNVRVDAVSFDFDGTLDSNAAMRELCRMYRSAGKKVYILTSRPPIEYRNQDLYRIAKECGFELQEILFSWGTTKAKMLEDYRIDLHFDNDPHAIHEINQLCGPGVGVLIHYQYLAQDIYGD